MDNECYKMDYVQFIHALSMYKFASNPFYIIYRPYFIIFIRASSLKPRLSSNGLILQDCYCKIRAMIITWTCASPC